MQTNESDLLPVCVFPTKYGSGMNTLKDAGHVGVCGTLEESLYTPYESDAHFVCYHITGFPVWPRINKPCLPELRAIGHDIRLRYMAFDYDTENHEPWTGEEQRTAFLERIQIAADSLPMIMRWTYLYFSLKGARLVYVLDRDVKAEDYEKHHRWMIVQFASAGLPLDTGCTDWTRVFRLPYVRRDGVNTWEQDYCQILDQPDNVLEVDGLGMMEKTQGTLGALAEYSSERTNDPKPTPEEAHALLWTVSPSETRKQRVPTQFMRHARTALKSRACFPCIYEYKPLAEKGARNSKLTSYVGQAVAMLAEYEVTTPQHIYALFYDAAIQMEPDKSTQPWDDILWSLCKRIWQRDGAIRNMRAREKAQLRDMAAAGHTALPPEVTPEAMGEGLDAISIAKKMRLWISEEDAPGLWSNDENEILSWFSRHLIVSHGSQCHCLNPFSGGYDPLPVSMTQLVARLRVLGYEQFVNLKDNEGKDIRAGNLLNEMGTIVSRIEAMPEIPFAKVSRFDQPDASLMLPTFSRTKMQGEWNETAEIWLRLMFGDHFELACRWIAYALAWDEGPICALSLQGPAGSGKKLLVQGLAECLKTPALAGPDDLVGNYQYGLMQSPFLVINEGWPNRRSMTSHPADRFRQLVSGEAGVANMKYQAPVRVINPVRIIFTANNTDVIRELAQGRDLSPDDRKALALRVIHLNIDDEASKWLDQSGGINLTRGWIAGDAGDKSDFVLARHFMWLYEKRATWKKDNRFLVEGDVSGALMNELRLGGPIVPVLMETIVRLVESKKSVEFRGVTFENKSLYVLIADVLNFWRKNLSETMRSENLTTSRISKVLPSIEADQNDGRRITLKTRPDIGKAHWRKLDLSLLLAFAQENGIPCPVLESMYNYVEFGVGPEPRWGTTMTERKQDGLVYSIADRSVAGQMTGEKAQ
jgi:hypothetical protein